MAAARVKQLEDKLARYERVLNGCSRCKATLALEEVQGPTVPSAASPTAGSSRRNGPKDSSTASSLSSEKKKTATRQGQSTQLTKQTTSDTRSKKDAVEPSHDPVRQSNRLSQQAAVDPGTSLTGNSSTDQNPAAHSLNLRPRTLKPSVIVQDTQSANTNRSTASGPSHSRSYSGARSSRNDPHKQAGWMVSADKMLTEVPLGWVWHVKLLQVDKSLLAAVTIDTVADDVTDTVEDTQNKDHLLMLVRGFAHRHSVQRVNFQHFLLVCLCIVLSTQRVPRSSIVETLRICISDTSEANIGKYLTGAKWANEMMNRLFFTAWRYRAIDLIIMWDRSVATYGKVASTTESTNDLFVTHLTQPDFFKDVEEIPNRVQSTIPWILKKELGDEISYRTICQALGYSNEYISETENLQSSGQPRADSDFQSSGDRVSTSESPPFHSARESADSTSSLPCGPSVLLPSGDNDGAAYSQAWSLLGKQALPRNDHNDSGHKDAAANQIADSQRLGRTTPDRSAQSLGDSTRSPPATQNPKRPLPDSPSSQSQSDDSTTQRQEERERPSREDIGSSSRPGKKDSHKRRDRG